MNDEQTYSIHYGGPVKSFEGGRIGGRVVTFSGHRDPDRTKEFFDAATDFWLNGSGERRPILYRHGLDKTIKRRRFGEVQLQKSVDGIWANGFIAGRDPDSLKLLKLAEAGALNWSTGSVGHLVTTSPVGDSFHVDEWPISECSLCSHDTVAEPRNIISLKEFAMGTEHDFYSLRIPSERDYNAEADAIMQEYYQHKAREIYIETLKRQHELRMMGFGV
jgi:hypothetical protein